MNLALLLRVLLVAGLAGAPQCPAGRRRLARALMVFAASDVGPAFAQIVPQFERKTQTDVTLVLGSTGMLAQQIRNGAPADVFFAANESFITDLAAENLTLRQTHTLYARGRIATVTLKSGGIRINDLKDLADPRIKRIAIANPQHAPYGLAAKQAMEAVGLWQTLEPKLVFGENVQQAVQFVRSGSAEAGIVARSVADTSDLTLDARRRPPSRAAQSDGGRPCAHEAAGRIDVVHRIRQRHAGTTRDAAVRIPAAGRIVLEMDLFPVWLSLRVALLATLLTVVAGVPVAWLLARRRFPGRDLLSAALLSPLVLPPTVLGYYLLMLIGSRGAIGRVLAGWNIELAFTWRAAVLAAAVGSFPLLIKTAQSGFESVDRRLEQAAETLGHSELSIFWTISVPLAWRAILAGTVLAFCRAFGDFGITLMVAGNIPGRTQTLPLAIYDHVQANQLDQANTLSLVSIGIVLFLMLALGRAARLRF